MRHIVCRQSRVYLRKTSLNYWWPDCNWHKQNNRDDNPCPGIPYSYRESVWSTLHIVVRPDPCSIGYSTVSTRGYGIFSHRPWPCDTVHNANNPDDRSCRYKSWFFPTWLNSDTVHSVRQNDRCNTRCSTVWNRGRKTLSQPSACGIDHSKNTPDDTSLWRRELFFHPWLISDTPHSVRQNDRCNTPCNTVWNRGRKTVVQPSACGIDHNANTPDDRSCCCKSWICHPWLIFDILHSVGQNDRCNTRCSTVWNRGSRILAQ